MSGLAADRDDYLSVVSCAAGQLAELGYFWQPDCGSAGSSTNGREAKLLAFTPVARRNGFQSLLYRGAWERGFAPIPVLDFYALPKIPWPGRMVCHFHWLGGVTRESCDEADAEARVGAFEKLLQHLRHQGRQIVWTVHNALPHDTNWPEQDLKIRQLISREADLIHVMTEGTGEALKGYYDLPEHKVFSVPHPAYSGFYPDSVTRHEARAQLGVPQDSHVFLTFGAIQRYKGYERLVHAFEHMALKPRDRKPFLIIAGKATDPQMSRELRAWALTRNDVLTVVKAIPNEDIQLFYRAADVAVCPYSATLNSGAALLAITYGKAVIGPRAGGFVDNVGPTCAWLYDPRDNGYGSLLNAMEESSVSTALQAKSIAAAERARALSPQSASSRFFTHLEAINK